MWFTVAGRVCPELNPPAWTFDVGPVDSPLQQIICVQSCDPLGLESFHVTALSVVDAAGDECLAFDIPQGPALPKQVKAFDAGGYAPACFQLRYLRPAAGQHACSVHVNTDAGVLVMEVDGETL